ncbi:DUF3152 domain-containing protein [uncultured Nocardioides sp.]|uniref:DUF3152 domain-containing protein n=1 Tax=uncultured Nocardioides sp. TaxID=198441 RepID=UPI00260857F5|nr:DUF3152 domain-containing protein [uncultured Nocardioides sp.]
MTRGSGRAGGRRRSLPGTHRGARPERRRTPLAVRTVGLIAVGGLATGFGHHLGPTGDSAGDPTASGALDTAPAPVTGDSRADGPEATEVPRGSTASLSPRPRRASRPRPVPSVGPGTFRIADGAAGPAAEEAEYGELAYTVEVEDGLPFDPVATGRRVERVLEHPRSWQTLLGQPLRRTTEVPDFRVLVASPGTTDALCAPLQTMGQVSCRNGDLVVLNAVRWAEGIPDYAGALGQYRTYLVNHEVGHRLGQAHVECPAPGTPAPVMQQQTYGLDGCTRNAWPG